ncbi:MAG: hypothetical protein V1724_06600, partial [Chloroflexota bacterium]
MLEKLFKDSAGQAQFKNAVAAGIKMSIGKFYEAKREWLASQSPMGSTAEGTPSEADEHEEAAGDEERPSSAVPEAIVPPATGAPQKG